MGSSSSQTSNTSRASLGRQPWSAPKGRHRVESVQGESSFLPLTGDNVSACGRRVDEYVLKVVLHEVCDVAAIFAAGPFQESRDRQQAHLDRFSCCL